MRYPPARSARRQNPEDVRPAQVIGEEFQPALEIHPEDLSDEGIEYLTASQAQALQEELRKVERFNARTMGEISTKKSRIAELTAKLRGTHGLEESLRWLRGRARSLKGDLDAERAAKAIRLLPGWRAEAVPAKKVVPLNGNTEYEKFPQAFHVLEVARGVAEPKGGNASYRIYDYFLDRDYDHKGDFVTPRSLAATYTVVPKGFDYASAPQGRYVEKLTPTEANFDYLPTWFPKDVPYVRLSKITVVLDEGDPVLRVAPPGRSFTTIPSGTKAWKSLYDLGIAEAAADQVGTVERRVEAWKRSAEAGWNRSLCAWCFAPAAVTPVSGHMVDHRYTRQGIGENINPCPGNQYAPYAKSPAGTQAHAESLERALKYEKEHLAKMQEYPEKQIYYVQVETRDARGRTTVQYDEVRMGDPRFPKAHELGVRKQERIIADIRHTIPFLRAAVRLWKPGGADLHEVQRQVSAEDRVRLNPRRPLVRYVQRRRSR
jgi:hypothetical protein